MNVMNIREAVRLPAGRASHAAALLSGHVVVAGGSAWSEDRSTKSWLADTLIFDGSQWHAGPNLPTPVAEPAFASNGECLILIGGLAGPDSPSCNVHCISMSSGRPRVTSFSPLPVTHCAGAAAVLNNQLYVFGGYLNGQLSNHLYMLDLATPTNSWIMRAELPGVPRAYPALISCGSSLYALGGLHINDEGLHVIREVFQYSPPNNSWIKRGELRDGGYAWSGCAVNEREIILGGRSDGAIHADLLMINIQDLTMRNVGQSIIPSTCAPMISINPTTYWLIGGEPDANRSRTERITEIVLKN